MWISADARSRVIFILGGVAYKWSGWYGCQLESREWRRPPAGTQREIYIGVYDKPVTMTLFTTKREGLKIRSTWGVASHGTINEHRERIIALRTLLREMV